jgi:hypothetical protein
MDECSYSIIFIVFYIVALTYVMKTHFHYIGYIMLLIVYLVNILYVGSNSGSYTGLINGLFPPSILTSFTMNSLVKFAIFMIVFFSLYSLIRMIDTYNYLIGQNKTYDIRISTYHKNNVDRFNITFIVSNVVLMAMFSLMTMFGSAISVPIFLFLLALSFISMLLQIGFSTSFSGMKYDFISKYSRDIQSKYEDWKK